MVCVVQYIPNLDYRWTQICVYVFDIVCWHMYIIMTFTRFSLWFICTHHIWIHQLQNCPAWEIFGLPQSIHIYNMVRAKSAVHFLQNPLFPRVPFANIHCSFCPDELDTEALVAELRLYDSLALFPLIFTSPQIQQDSRSTSPRLLDCHQLLSDSTTVSKLFCPQLTCPALISVPPYSWGWLQDTNLITGPPSHNLKFQIIPHYF